MAAIVGWIDFNWRHLGTSLMMLNPYNYVFTFYASVFKRSAHARWK